MPELSADHDRAVETATRDERRDRLEHEAEDAERKATEAIGLWMTAVRRMITSAPSIGDALLEARDRGVEDGPR